MRRRVLIADPDAHVTSLVARTVRRLGFEPVHARPDEVPPPVDAIVLDPGSDEGRSLVRRFGERMPPVICFSAHPREAGLAPPESVAYLVKPASPDELDSVLRDVLETA